MEGVGTVSQVRMAGSVALSILHLAWVGLVAGSSTVAVALDGLGGERYRRTAAAVAGLTGPILVTVAGLVVTTTLTLVAARAAHPLLVQTGAYWAGTLFTLLTGLAALGLFASLLEGGRWGALRPAIGLAGIGLVLTACFLLCSGAGVLLQPEAWPTAEPAHRFLLTWSGTGRFLEFTCLSLFATGVVIMTVGNRLEAPEEAAFLRRFGARMALVFLLAWPPALLFTHLNLPAIALSAGIWALAAAGLGVAGLVAWTVAGVPGARPPHTRTLLAASIALFGVLAASDHLARENALDEATLAGVTPAPAPVVPPIEVAAAPAGKLAAGKAVFDRVCHLCHRFDTKVVGPPLNVVVPKYRKDPAALKAFIRNPVKKDPKFPAMPKPAINELELDAVAAYVLDQAKP
jgi:mono/diheme cytochrome c family protein